MVRPIFADPPQARRTSRAKASIRPGAGEDPVNNRDFPAVRERTGTTAVHSLPALWLFGTSLFNATDPLPCAGVARRSAPSAPSWKLGPGYRIAVFLLWPLMTWFTKRDWRGMENLNTDDGGIIVAGNHISWFDPLVISHALWENDRPPRFLAKESVFRVPIVGSIIRSARTDPGLSGDP